MPGTTLSTLQIWTYLITPRHLSLKEINWHKPYFKMQKDLFHYFEIQILFKPTESKSVLANIWKETGIIIHSNSVSQTTNVEEILKGSSPKKSSLPTKKKKLNFIFNAMLIIYTNCKGVLPFPLWTGSHLC